MKISKETFDFYSGVDQVLLSNCKQSAGTKLARNHISCTCVNNILFVSKINRETILHNDLETLNIDANIVLDFMKKLFFNVHVRNGSLFNS